MISALLTSFLALGSNLASGQPFSTSITTQEWAPLRYCNNGYAGNTSMLNTIDTFADWLSEQPTKNISKSVGSYRYQQTVDGFCMQLLLVNWDCGYDITVNGPSLAWTARSVPAQCYGVGESGPMGVAYYADEETKHDYWKEVFSYLSPCDTYYPKGACGVARCPGDNQTTLRDPNVPCL